MGKNNYLAQKAAMEQAIFASGENLGFQKLWDCVQIALHDPEIMGKDTFGKARIAKIYEGLKKYTDYFQAAFTLDVDADIAQRDMDAMLGEIWGDELAPFYERYPDLKKIKYDKKRKGWV